MSRAAAIAFWIVATPILAAGMVYAIGETIEHFVPQPTAAQRFGCEKNYINERGEDTGECR